MKAFELLDLETQLNHTLIQEGEQPLRYLHSQDYIDWAESATRADYESHALTRLMACYPNDDLQFEVLPWYVKARNELGLACLKKDEIILNLSDLYISDFQQEQLTATTCIDNLAQLYRLSYSLIVLNGFEDLANALEEASTQSGYSDYFYPGFNADKLEELLHKEINNFHIYRQFPELVWHLSDYVCGECQSIGERVLEPEKPGLIQALKSIFQPGKERHWGCGHHDLVPLHTVLGRQIFCQILEKKTKKTPHECGATEKSME